MGRFLPVLLWFSSTSLGCCCFLCVVNDALFSKQWYFQRHFSVLFLECINRTLLLYRRDWINDIIVTFAVGFYFYSLQWVLTSEIELKGSKKFDLSGIFRKILKTTLSDFKDLLFGAVYTVGIGCWNASHYFFFCIQDNCLSVSLTLYNYCFRDK